MGEGYLFVLVRININIMLYAEITTAFIIGIILIILCCWLFKSKCKWYIRLLLSSALGALMIVAFNVFGIIRLPLNPMNAFIIGFLGVPGLILLILIVTVL